ncbi:MAG: uroporphyrinogen decarboxylase [Bellilinea sp.]|nr:MAG: uroporphyrinogen decarboxylase [Bellilinea sp.]
MSKLSHRKRLEQCLAGEKTDRPPVALWRHFPIDDQSPENLAAAVANFQHTFDFDFIKVTPASSYCVKDWGAKDIWRGNPEGTRDYVEPVIKNIHDWEKLEVLNPRKGHLGQMLKCLNLIVKEFSKTTPVIQTIFSPLSQAKNLVGKENLLYHMRAYPEALKAGLETITLSTLNFIEELKKTGIDGIFYAVQHAQFSILSPSEFQTFGRNYDLQILETAKSFWLNVAHIHGENIMFEQIYDYPVQVLNWHDQQSPPSLRDAQNQFKGVVCGGLRQWETMVLGTPERVYQEAKNAIDQTAGKRFILGTGCVIPITTPFGNIFAARRAVEHSNQ